MTCVIVDDDPNAVAGLVSYMESFPGMEVKATFTNPVDAMAFLLKNKVNLLLLDVDMPKVNGIELANSIRGQVGKLVFTTAHTKYAFDAFESHADAYLLKPFSLAKMLATLHRLFPEELETEKNAMEMGSEEDFIFVKAKQGSKLIKVKLKELVVIESKNNYVELQALDRQVITYMTLSELAKKLNGQPDFIQVQRSFIINKHFIEYVEGNTLVMASGAKITVGEMYRPTFQSFLDERVIKMGKKR
ncbi:LytR/AlgR family response regulator transcription factor [Pedobacter xixiisoli]|uniref:Two component transcriptional regulator, LytTR family n=1 Tax=Pedobacter xixiisoli TaxID=1476464 RepID=A0A286ADW8_9SPHI|nr:LytTR family DNA-binding domain-containing protein [Pedobacter xixiisoli]SOD20101.1 two component transcriptional regulator, LytTR family [Pedobacter xixiisoli]